MQPDAVQLDPLDDHGSDLSVDVDRIGTGTEILRLFSKNFPKE
jgi:hypothetical protein